MGNDVIGIAESRLIPSDSNNDYLLPGFQTPIWFDQYPKYPNTRPPHGLLVFLNSQTVAIFNTYIRISAGGNYCA